MSDAACRIKGCECKAFRYEAGEHPGACDVVGCHHFDSNHGPSREELRSQVATLQAQLSVVTAARDRLRAALERERNERAVNSLAWKLRNRTLERNALQAERDALAAPPPAPPAGTPQADLTKLINFPSDSDATEQARVIAATPAPPEGPKEGA